MQDFWHDIERFDSKCALIEGEKRVTYNELIQMSDTLGKVMQTRTLCFLCAENNVESVIGYIAMLRKEVVPIMINPEINSEFYRALLDVYQPRYIWTKKDTSECPKEYVVQYQYGKFLLYAKETCPDVMLTKTLALLLTTSGSTGSPKLVKQSYWNIVSNANSIAEYLGIKSSDIPITTLPLYYTYGLSILNSHLLMGASVVLNQSSIMSKEFWGKIKKYEVTTFGGVPFMYETLLKLKFENMDMPSLKTLTQAGGKLDADICIKYEEICRSKGIKFFVMYGQTEATARMSYLPWENLRTKAGSIGIAVPGGQFELIDDAGNQIELPGEVGELIYKGDNVTLGYAENKADLSKGDERKGVLQTGDMAYFDEDGFYYIVGRKKRFLKIYGSRINLDEIELLLKKQNLEAVCSGTDDRLHVYITDEFEIEHVQKWLQSYLAINRQAIFVSYIKEIPRNEAGKILYSQLK